MTPKQKIGVAHGILSAVAFLHANDIIHRDIKVVISFLSFIIFSFFSSFSFFSPSNRLLSSQTENVLLNDDMKPVLADFSLAKVFNTELHVCLPLLFLLFPFILFLTLLPFSFSCSPLGFYTYPHHWNCYLYSP